MKDLKVYYDDGEIEIFKEVSFEVYDLESIVSPVFNALIFENRESKVQICIMLDRVKKIEFVDSKK